MSSAASLQDAFAKAIELNDSRRVQYFIASNTVDINQLLGSAPALVLAAERGREEIVDLLLQAGALIDTPRSDGTTACHAATERGHTAVLASLLAHRANLHSRDSRGRSPVDVACRTGQDVALVMLMDAGAPLDNVDRMRLCRAASRSLLIVNALLRRGVIRELRDSDKCTPLHHAALHSTDSVSETMRALVDVCGVDINARDSLGRTCSMVCASAGKGNRLKWAINAGADIECVDNSGLTALHHACASATVECIFLLIAAGADVDRVSATGDTALHALAHATGRQQVLLSCMHALLSAGAYIDAVNRRGVSARQALADCGMRVPVDRVDPAVIDAARRRVVKTCIGLVKQRALQVCIGLQSRDLDALQMCEILVHACGSATHSIPFHVWWAIATTVKHLHRH